MTCLRPRLLPISAANSADLLCSPLEASENECRVRTAKAETVRERVLHKRLARFVRHIIQVSFRVGGVVVNRRRQFPPVDGEHGEDGFHAARRTEQMTRHRLGGTERQLICMRAEGLLDGERLASVAERSRSAVRVDVADLLRTNAGILNCPSDHADHTALRLVRRGAKKQLLMPVLLRYSPRVKCDIF